MALERPGGVGQLTPKLLARRLESWPEYEKLASTYRADACEAREHVRRHGQAFSQVAERFLEVASSMLNWTGPLFVPELFLLHEHRKDLRTAIQLRQWISVVEQKQLDAEDETDDAQLELRRYLRHKAAQKATGDFGSPVLERQQKLRVSRAEGRVRKLAQELQKAESELQEAEAAFPFTIEPDAEDDGYEEDDGAGSPGQSAAERRSPLERLALKVAELEQLHEDMAIHISKVSAERDSALVRYVNEKLEQRAREAQAELEFMCPILHERMKEPVVAADGHTYERQAIEKWMQLRNTSPMTGAPLQHRFLTKNFALRSIIASHDSRPREEHGQGTAEAGGSLAL
jgi:hypothetical protein